MAAAVESPNGATESPSVSLAHKRKHSAIDSEHMNGVVTNGDGKPVSQSSPLPTEDLKEFLKDLLVILERYRTLGIIV